MANSGKFTQYFTPDRTLQLDLEWRAVQNIEKNESTVYLELYFKSNHQLSSFNSGIVRPMFMTIDGHVSPTWQVTKSIKGLQRRHIGSWSRVVKHDENGNKSLNIGASFTWQVTWGGVWVDTVKTGGRITLNNIKRKSTSNTKPTFALGQNLSVAINRQSGNFKHFVVLDIKDKSGNWVNVRMDHGQGSSCFMKFTVPQKSIMFKALGGRASTESRMHIHTGTGGSNDTNLGYYTYYGTIKTNDSSNATSTPLQLDSSSGATIKINKYVSLMLDYSFEIVVGSRKFYKTAIGGKDSLDWNLTAAEKLQIMNDNPNAKTIKGKLNTTTYYELHNKDTKIRDVKSSDVYFEIKNSEPTIGGKFTIVDANNTVKTVLGNAANTFVQGISSLNISVPANMATAKNGAKISSHTVYIDGISRSVGNSGAAHTIAFGTVKSSGSIDVKFEAIDTRGFRTSTSMKINVLPYSKPILTGSFERQNGFSELVDLDVGGEYSPLSMGETNKNLITRLQYRYKVGTGGWTGYKNLSIKTVNGGFTTTKVSEKVATTSNFQAEVVITDKFNTSTIVLNGTSAKPILFIDSFYENVGIGKYPDKGIALDVDGTVKATNLNVDSMDSSSIKVGSSKFNISAKENIIVYGGSSTFNGYHIIDSPSCNTNSTFYFQTKGSTPANISTREVQFAKTSFNQKASSILTSNDGKTLILRGDRIDIETSSGSGRGFMDIHKVHARHIETNSGSNGIFINEDRREFGDLQLTKDSRSAYLLSRSTYARTYGSSANVFITENGVFGRSVSAKKYKYAITPIKNNPDEMVEFGEKILDIQPSTWYDKSEVDDMVEEYEKGIKSASTDRRRLQKQYGLIAEDFIEAGLPEFVSYGVDGQVEGLQYDRAWITLIPIVKNLKERISHLEEVNEKLMEDKGLQ